MTDPVPPGGEVMCSCGAMHKPKDIADRILVVLHSLANEDFDWNDADWFLKCLLPVVREYGEEQGRRRAAEEVRRIADDPALSTVTHTANFGLPSRVVPVAALYRVADRLARAAALAPEARPE
ncbi:MAG: hypothetical protein JWO67_2233 [Streptosporangiaceae bacterium]|nr:hypothetical protein [Streptosporangiaceae bacterium]